MKSFLRTNPTKILDIQSSDITIKIIRNTDFVVEKIVVQQLKMDSYRTRLPKQSEAFLIASTSFEEKRINLGNIDNLNANYEESLKEFCTDTVYFRLIVVDKNDFKILASCESPYLIDELHSSRKGLFDIQYLDLGEKLWSLKISENDNQKPRILIHNNPVLQLKSKIDQKDPLFRMMILPSSFEAVLFHLALNPAVEPGIQSWKKQWQEFCELHEISFPDENSDDYFTSEEIEAYIKWAKDTTERVFLGIKGVAKAIKSIEELIK